MTQKEREIYEYYVSRREREEVDSVRSSYHVTYVVCSIFILLTPASDYMGMEVSVESTILPHITYRISNVECRMSNAEHGNEKEKEWDNGNRCRRRGNC